jgi:hypothetical protein
LIVFVFIRFSRIYVFLPFLLVFHRFLFVFISFTLFLSVKIISCSLNEKFVISVKVKTRI